MRGALLFFLFLFSFQSFALETDQFTLPSTALEDIGPILDGWFRSDLNSALVDLPPEATPDEIREYFFKKVSRCEIGTRRIPINFVGGFCFVFFLEHYLKKLSAISPNIAWSYFPKDSIYSPGASPGVLGGAYENGVWFQALSSTINVFGVHIGTDKPSHFIKLGRDYYNHYRKLRVKGWGERAAVVQTVDDMGVKSEAGYLGFDVSGNYANADLSANFAGFWFYRNLFEDIFWNGQVKKSIISRNDKTRLWELNTTEILKPFISLHMNEAFNPGTYVKGIKTENLIKNIKDRCKQWSALSRGHGYWDEFRTLSQSLKTLGGWDYGWRRVDGLTPELDQLCTH